MTINCGVILYGPPASGKDTITRELQQLDSRCELFPRLKVGGGRREGYRFIDHERLTRAIELNDIAWMNHRYNATYAVDISGLKTHLKAHITVLHLGQIEAIQAIKLATPGTLWWTVALWCPRNIALARLVARDPLDTQQRIAAWDATGEFAEADQTIDTAVLSAADAAKAIHQSLSMTCE